MVNAIVRPQSVTQLDSISTAAANQFYRPFLPALLNSEQPTTPLPDCWVDKLELDSVSAACAAHPKKIKLLVLYGSLRERYASDTFTAHPYDHPKLRAGVKYDLLEKERNLIDFFGI